MNKGDKLHQKHPYFYFLVVGENWLILSFKSDDLLHLIMSSESYNDSSFRSG
jgi:hypothetical protein